jgi:hypothetical protein
MNVVSEVLRDLERDRFFGSLEIKFEAGRAVLLRKTETLKPANESCRDNRGDRNEHSDGF